MKKIAFVTPWYGENISGGAEMELRGISSHIKDAGHEVEILTTCVKDFNSDWNVNHHKSGKTIENGLTVRRFPVKKRDVKKFDEVNFKLMNGMSITPEEEKIYIEEMVNSPRLYDYIKEKKDGYGAFIYIPYMFGTTYYGIQQCPEKSVMIPCFHDESYIYLDIYKRVFEHIAGMIYLSKPEEELANQVLELGDVNQAVLGAGVDTDWHGDAQAFLNKYDIRTPFILYAGRKDAGKNVGILIQYFCEYKKRNENQLKLVLIGGGNIHIPEEYKRDIVDLGFVPIQDKYDAYAAADFLCQPSTHESFSLVIMESWLAGRPVLVHEQCEVTKSFAIETGGGLYFNDFFDFEGCVNYFLDNERKTGQMGKGGCQYVKEHFSWDVVVDRYLKFITQVIGC